MVFYRAGKYQEFYSLFKKNSFKPTNLTLINFYNQLTFLMHCKKSNKSDMII
nr:hypothetical protein [Mucilaginibacter sp. SP1R1]